MRLGLALVLGFLVAFAITGRTASAGDAAVKTYGTSWLPANPSIGVGEKVTWSDTSGIHNLYIEGEPDPAASEGSPWSLSRTFSSEGTFKFRCAIHSSDFDHGMVGAVTVSRTPTTSGTGTSTTVPGESQPTDTTTVPAQTQQTTAADTTAPAFNGRLRRRSTRRALIIELGSSEAATLDATVLRRPPRGRSFSRVRHSSLHVNQGRNVLTLLRRARFRSGAYRVRLRLEDAAGNRSAPRTLNFKLG